MAAILQSHYSWGAESCHKGFTGREAQPIRSLTFEYELLLRQPLPTKGSRADAKGASLRAGTFGTRPDSLFWVDPDKTFRYAEYRVFFDWSGNSFGPVSFRSRG